MKKLGKLIGVGLVGAALVGAAIHVAKKVKEVDDFDEGFYDDEDFDDFEDDDILSEEDFDDNFHQNLESNDMFLEHIGIDKNACINAIYEASDLYTMEELENMSDSDLLDTYIEVTVPEKEEESSLDVFKLLNDDLTRIEVIDILLKSNDSDKEDKITFIKEDLEALSDGELTQVYADYKQSLK